MNVKPGDLAISVGGERIEHIGAIVEVLRPYLCDTARWKYPANWVVLYRGREYAAADCCLRPIRPDGITTEEVKELFSPSPTKESEKV